MQERQAAFTPRAGDGRKKSTHGERQAASTPIAGMESAHQRPAASTQRYGNDRILTTPENDLTVSPGPDVRTTGITELPSPSEPMGVLIHCSGAMSNLNVPGFAPLHSPWVKADYHRIQSYMRQIHYLIGLPDHVFPDSIPQIPYLIGVPVWILQYNLNPEIDQGNPPAGILKFGSIILSPQPNTGIQGNDYQSTALEMGSRVVSRIDGFNLLPQHLEVLCAFCEFVQRHAERFTRLATRSEFEAYYQWYSVLKVRDGDIKWKSLPFPYDTALLGKEYANVLSWVDDGQNNQPAAVPTNNIVVEEQNVRTTGLLTPGGESQREAAGQRDNSTERRRRLGRARTANWRERKRQQKLGVKRIHGSATRSS